MVHYHAASGGIMIYKLAWMCRDRTAGMSHRVIYAYSACAAVTLRYAKMLHFVGRSVSQKEVVNIQQRLWLVSTRVSYRNIGNRKK